MQGDKRAEIQLRRELLLARSHDLRQRVGQEAQVLQRPLALADRTRDGIHWLAARPLWVAALVAIPVVLRPRRALTWGLKLWGGWRLWRQVREMLPPRRAP